MKKLLEYIKKFIHWVRQDGLLHILVSALIVCAFGFIHPLWIPCFIAFAIGISKEVYDLVTDKGYAELHDVLCDLIGIAIGLFVVMIDEYCYVLVL